MNIYRLDFRASCPVNGETIVYRLEIRSPKMIEVERIQEVVGAWPSGFHEAIADDLIKQFPLSYQVMVAEHHGVEIETHRGIL